MLSRLVIISRLCTRNITIPASGNINIATIASPSRQAFSSVGSDPANKIFTQRGTYKDWYPKPLLDDSEIEIEKAMDRPISRSECKKIYRLHIENPEIYSSKRLAEDYNISESCVRSIFISEETPPKQSKVVELCRLHNGNPEVYTVARLAKDYKCSVPFVEITLHEFKFCKRTKLPRSEISHPISFIVSHIYQAGFEIPHYFA